MTVTSPVLTIADTGVVLVRVPGEGCAACEALAGAAPGIVVSGCGLAAGASSGHATALARAGGGLSFFLAGGDLYEGVATREILARVQRSSEPHEQAAARAKDLWRRPRRWGVSDPGDDRQVLTALTFVLDERFSRRAARGWVKAGVTAMVAHWWRDVDRSPREAGAWVAAGVVEPNEASSWRRSGNNAAVVARWAAAGIPAAHAKQWCERGASIEQALAFGHCDAWDFAYGALAHGDARWGALVDCAAWKFVSSARQAGRSPDQVRALAEALTAGVDAAQLRQAAHAQRRAGEYARWMTLGVWPRATDEEFAVVAAGLSDLDWLDLRVCAAAGMPVQEAAAYLRDGGDMEPVRLMAALVG